MSFRDVANRLHGALAVCSVLAAMVVGALAIPSPASAQMGQGNCVGQPPLAALEARADVPAVRVAPVELGKVAAKELPEFASFGGQLVVLRLQWPSITASPAIAGARTACIVVWKKTPGGDWWSFVHRILPAGTQEISDVPFGEAGEYCYRFMVIADDARSEVSESCFNVDQAQGPPSLDSGPELLARPNAGQSFSYEWSWIAGVALLIAAVALPVGWSQRHRR
ncbi:MAG: hypothetical protein HY875_06705 [Chloroflexi bacterium]|nr:hypothetical protein [Chloroflexota bacterium]